MFFGFFSASSPLPVFPLMLYFKAVAYGLYGMGAENYMKWPPGGQVCQL